MNPATINLISIVITVCFVLLAFVSYIPGIKDWMYLSAPSMSHLFLGIILLVMGNIIASIYIILQWRWSNQYISANQSNFIWTFFASMIAQLVVYLTFAMGEEQREITLGYLSDNRSVALIICSIFIFYYAFSSIWAWKNPLPVASGQPIPEYPIMKSISIFSIINLVLFILLWARFWLGGE